MDFRVFDRARRQVGPLELDLVESYAKGILPRREFVRRATVIGLSVPFISAIISACGSDDDGGSSGTSGGTGTAPAGTGTGTPGGTIKVASPEAGRPARPGRDAGPRHATASSPSASSSCARWVTTTSRPGWPRAGAPTTTAASGRSTCARASSGRTARTSRSADVAATMDRLVAAGNSGLKGVIEAGAVDSSDPNVAVFTLAGPQRQLPVSGLGLQRAVGHHARLLRVGHDARRHAQRHRGVQAGQVRRRHRRHVRPQRRRGGVAQTPLDGSEWLFFDDLGAMVTTTTRRRGRRHRAVPGHRR